MVVADGKFHTVLPQKFGGSEGHPRLPKVISVPPILNIKVDSSSTLVINMLKWKSVDSKSYYDEYVPSCSFQLFFGDVEYFYTKSSTLEGQCTII
jgi:hypothetical protein